MNKLLELKTKYRQLLDYGPIPETVKDALEEAFVDWCVEYARSKLLFVKEVSFKSELDSVERQKFVEEHLKIMFDEYHKALHDGIDQDLLSLKEKKDT